MAEKLCQLGFKFTQNQELRSIDTDEKYTYIDDQNYEQMSQYVLEYIQEQLKEDYKMKEIWIPENKQPQCNIFVSDDFYQNRETCLILIQGGGQVRAGQWAKSACINQSLDIGSMFPFIKRARISG